MSVENPGHSVQIREHRNRQCTVGHQLTQKGYFDTVIF